MLELSMTLPIKVQNGGLFISRGVGRHPARRLESWEIIFVEKDDSGATSIKPLYEFKEFRENMDAVKAYINGYFGAIPCVETSVDVLKTIIKNQKIYESLAK